jgi:hypothetical protein
VTKIRSPQGPGDESPVASGPGDESLVASGPGDEIVFKPESTEGDDSFAVDWLAEDHAPSDPSDRLLPMESLSPVDPWDISAGLCPWRA